MTDNFDSTYAMLLPTGEWGLISTRDTHGGTKQMLTPTSFHNATVMQRYLWRKWEKEGELIPAELHRTVKLTRSGSEGQMDQGAPGEPCDVGMAVDERNELLVALTNLLSAGITVNGSCGVQAWREAKDVVARLGPVVGAEEYSARLTAKVDETEKHKKQLAKMLKALRAISEVCDQLSQEIHPPRLKGGAAGVASAVRSFITDWETPSSPDDPDQQRLFRPCGCGIIPGRLNGRVQGDRTMIPAKYQHPRYGMRMPVKSKSLYERLGGIFAIAAVVDLFSDAIIEDPLVGRTSPNPALSEWHTKSLDRLPGLKWMRTMWVADITGGPYRFVPSVPEPGRMNLSNAHAKFKITSEEFDRVAEILGHTLNHFKVPDAEKAEVLAAFAAHKQEVVSG